MLNYRSGKQTEREKWTQLLQRGDPRAADELAPIEYPFELEYLRGWAHDLYETSDGPLTWIEMQAWQHTTGITLLAHEVRPLRSMVSALQARPVEINAPTEKDPLDFDNDDD